MSISPTMRRMMTVTASTKRSPAVVSGKRTEAVIYLKSIKISQLMPASKRLYERAELHVAYNLSETFCDGSLDIQLGDYLTVNGRDYPVKIVEDWAGYLVLLLEDMKNKP